MKKGQRKHREKRLIATTTFRSIRRTNLITVPPEMVPWPHGTRLILRWDEGSEALLIRREVDVYVERKI